MLTFTRPYKQKFVGSIVMAIVLAAITPVRPKLIEITVNKYIAAADKTFADKAIETLVWITVFQIGFTILETILRFYFSYITSWLGQAVVKDMRVKVFGKVISLNLRQFDKTPIGTLTTRTIDDIERINDIFSDGLIPIIADLLSILCVLGIMLYTDWRLDAYQPDSFSHHHRCHLLF